MSQIQNVITTTFRARGNQAIATMGSVAQGFGTIGRVINENSRMSERLNAQWRAIGTTIRYAVAGTAVFGLTQMATKLRDVQTQLGLIAAIGSQPGGGTIGGRALTDNQVTRMGDSLRNAAVTAIQPVTEMNDAAINFLSTVQNARPSEIPSIITNIGQAARLAQTPVEDLTKAATTMNIAFGRPNNLSTIKQFNRQFFALTTLAPGGRQAGKEIVNQFGPLSAIFSLGRGNVDPKESQAQMMSLVLGSLRFGGSPSTSLRGLQFFGQSLIQPATPAARAALSGIGITPQTIEKEGLYKNIIRFLQHISPPGRANARRIGNLDEEALAGIEESGGNLPGIPANQMQFLRTAIGRIHGVRSAVVLAEQLRQRPGTQSLSQDLAVMEKARDDTVDETLKMSAAWVRFRKRAKLARATAAVDAMTLQVAQAFEPVMNFVGGRVSGLQSAMSHHPALTRHVIQGGAAFMAAMGIGRFFGVGSLPGVRAIPGLRGLTGGRGFVMSQAAQAALSGNTALGASPQNPLYVIVVGQIFGGNTPGPNNNPTDPRNPGNWIKGFLGLAAAKAAAGKGLGARALRGGAGAAGLFSAEMPMLPDLFNYLVHGVDPTTGQRLNNSVFHRLLPINQGGFDSRQDYLKSLRRAQQMFPGTTNIESFEKRKLHGRADVFMTLDINQGGKIVRRTVHVPVDLWSGGRHPGAQGGRRQQRG